MTMTALVAFLIAIPCLFTQKTRRVRVIPGGGPLSLVNENIRYSIDDFLT